MQQRPTSINIFGTLNIVFAGLGIVGLLGSAALLFATPDGNNPVIKIMRENPGYAAWLKISFVLGIPSCAILAASGIGLLLMKPWARVLSIIYAIYAIILGLLGTVLNVVFLVMPMVRQAQEQNGPEAAGAIGGAIGGSLGGCIGLIYPVLLLIFMTRPNMIAAFQANKMPSAPPPLQ